MNEFFDNKCPYCGSDDIQSYGHINDLSIAVNSEEYVCNGKCQRIFYMQYSDERFIMKPTMKDRYLSMNSLALAEKEYFEKVAKEQGVDSELPICGNCVSYEWGKNLDDKFDRHCGSCYFQNERINFTISNSFIKGKLHALTKTTQCDNFYNFRTKEL